MQYIPHDDDEEITSLRITKRVRTKLGLLINGNEGINKGLERILDADLEKLPEPIAH